MSVRHGSATTREQLRRALGTRVHRLAGDEFCSRCLARQAIKS